MKLKLITTAVLFSSAISVSAEEYQVLSDITWSNVDTEWSDFGLEDDSYDTVELSGTYYFDKKESLGPYNEFEYINKVSKIDAAYVNRDSGENHLTQVKGELFVENFLIGAGYAEDKFDNDTTLFSLGYLFNDDLLVRVDAIDSDFSDTYYYISAAYNHQINETDYLGFTLATDDNTDYVTLSSKYFTHLGDDQYFTANVSFTDTDFGSTWALGSSYYFSKATSVSATLGDDDLYEVGAQHFFNENVALYASFASQDDLVETETYTIGLRAQF